MFYAYNNFIINIIVLIIIIEININIINTRKHCVTRTQTFYVSNPRKL